MTDCADCRELLGGYVLGAPRPRRDGASWSSTSRPARAAGGSTASWPASRRCSTSRARRTLSPRRRRRRSRRPCSTASRASAAARRPRPGGLAALSGSARRWRRRRRRWSLALAVAGVFSSEPAEAFGHVRHDTAAPVAPGPTSGRCAPAREVQLSVCGLPRARPGDVRALVHLEEGPLDQRRQLRRGPERPGGGGAHLGRAPRRLRAHARHARLRGRPRRGARRAASSTERGRTAAGSVPAYTPA